MANRLSNRVYTTNLLKGQELGMFFF